jgi:hypothetical protein
MLVSESFGIGTGKKSNVRNTRWSFVSKNRAPSHTTLTHFHENGIARWSPRDDSNRHHGLNVFFNHGAGARTQIQLGEALGYGSRIDYKALYSQLDDIQTKLRPAAENPARGISTGSKSPCKG